ncbi:hypothetical protein OAB57_01740 [Bacteriovoracaceae bacterium]|nr:hypothetical protein [Bacteriovoracaceae bacterium]
MLKKCITYLMWALTIFHFTSCAIIQETISTKSDADVANKLSDPHIQTFRFGDVIALKKILNERLALYSRGLGYLKKQTGVYKGVEKVPHEKRVVKIEMDINLLDAHLDNLLLIYPEDWDTKRDALNSKFQSLQKNYTDAYKMLF